MSETEYDHEKLFMVITQYSKNLSENIDLLRLLSTKVLMYRRKRQQHLRNIFMLRNKSFVIAAHILRTRTRKIWKKVMNAEN